jgi:hypothetical protein
MNERREVMLEIMRNDARSESVRDLCKVILLCVSFLIGTQVWGV